MRPFYSQWGYVFKTNESFIDRIRDGVMAGGEYGFGTSTREVMKVVSGVLAITLSGTDAWIDYFAADAFVVEASQSFGVRVSAQASYLCLYK
ncbi:MAG: pyrimidine/purine nucleoside phosphorylase [Mariprofundus sp.]